MQASESTNKTLEQQIEEINKLLKKIQYDQSEELMLLQKNHAINMKKLDKLQEYNKISDMTNQLFEKRISGIENAIISLNKSISNKQEN